MHERKRYGPWFRFEMVKDTDFEEVEEVAIDDMGRDLELMLDLLTYTQGADIAIEVINSISKVFLQCCT